MWRNELPGCARLCAGCAVLAVTVSADVPGLVDRAAAIFRSWRERLGQALEAAGIEAAAPGRWR